MLHDIQQKLKAPKDQYNSFGKYKYRSAESILEAVKPLIPAGYWLTLTDTIIECCGHAYIQSTARLMCADHNISATGLARMDDTRKGMDSAQLTGCASSYARKYALCGLFAIDDTRDSDTMPAETPTDTRLDEIKAARLKAGMTPQSVAQIAVQCGCKSFPHDMTDNQFNAIMERIEKCTAPAN